MDDRDLGLLACRLVVNVLDPDEREDAVRTLVDAGWAQTERGTWTPRRRPQRDDETRRE